MKRVRGEKLGSFAPAAHPSEAPGARQDCSRLYLGRSWGSGTDAQRTDRIQFLESRNGAISFSGNRSVVAVKFSGNFSRW